MPSPSKQIVLCWWKEVESDMSCFDRLFFFQEKSVILLDVLYLKVMFLFLCSKRMET
jgi:hypothetical protein